MTDLWRNVPFVFIWLYLLSNLIVVVKCSEGSIGSTPPPASWCVSDAGILDYILRWLPDSLVSPDGVCESRLGEGSFLCRHRYSGNYSSLCEELWCRDPESGECSQVSANDGIPCGNKQWCQNGRCVYSENAGGTSDACPFGDSLMPTSQGMSCQEMVSTQPWMCYDSFNEQMCCQSCRSIRRSMQGCPYGDRRAGCSANQCFSFVTDLQSACCETCAVIIHTLPPTSPTGSSPTDSSRTAPSEQTTGADGTTSRQTTGSDSTSGSTTVSGESPPTQDSTAVTAQSSQTPDQLTTGEGTQTSGPQTTDNNQQTTGSGPPESSSSQETTGDQQTSNPSIETTQGNTADSGSQQAVALGAGLGAGALVLVSILVVVVYAVRRRRSSMEHLPVDDSVSATGDYDNRSIDPDSFSPQAAGLSESSTTWYPSYRSTTTMS